MKVCDFVIPGLNEKNYGGAENGQPEYYPLPIVKTHGGKAVTCAFTLEPHELEWLKNGCRIYFTMFTGGVVCPIRVEVLNPTSPLEDMKRYFEIK